MGKCPANKISFVCDLTALGISDDLTFLGSALFTRRVSGPRVVLCSPPSVPSARPEEAPSADAAEDAQPLAVKGKYAKKIDGIHFESYGAHIDTYPCCYLTAACALGATREEMECFLERFENAVQDYRKGVGRKDAEAGEK